MTGEDSTTEDPVEDSRDASSYEVDGYNYATGWLTFAMLLAIVIAFGIGMNAELPRSPAEADGEPAEEQSQELPPDPKSKASDGGKLRIVERGYLRFTDLSDDSQVSWGAIVENTSEEMAVTGGVGFTLKDAGGDDLVGEFDGGVRVPVLLPGERTSVGGTDYVDGDAKTGKAKFSVGDLEWSRPDDLPLRTDPNGHTYHYDELTVTDVKARRVNEGETDPYWTEDGIEAHTDADGDLAIGFRVESDYSIMVQPQLMQAVFRDADGEIIGASSPDAAEARVEFPPGWSRHTLVIKDELPDEVDEENIEVYVRA